MAGKKRTTNGRKRRAVEDKRRPLKRVRSLNELRRLVTTDENYAAAARGECWYLVRWHVKGIRIDDDTAEGAVDALEQYVVGDRYGIDGNLTRAQRLLKVLWGVARLAARDDGTLLMRQIAEAVENHCGTEYHRQLENELIGWIWRPLREQRLESLMRLKGKRQFEWLRYAIGGRASVRVAEVIRRRRKPAEDDDDDYPEPGWRG